MTDLPDFTTVISSNIASIAHQGTTLYVRFRSGQTWKYSDVPETEYNALCGAQSIGKHFNAFIKDKYAAEKVEEPLDAA